MIQKKLFWVETLKDGSVGRTGELDIKGRNGSIVRCYEATDLADACAQAKVWFEKRKEQNRVRARKSYQAFKEANPTLCPSHRNETLPCAKCLPIHRKSAERIRSGETGRAQSAEEARDKYVANHRLCRFLSMPALLRRFDEMGPVAFRAWIVAWIADASTDAPMAQAAE